MHGGIRLGCVLLICSFVFSYAADQGSKKDRLEQSLSLVAAEGGAVSLPVLHVEIHAQLPQVPSGSSSPFFPRSRTIKSNGSKNSGSRRSSAEEDYATKDTDTEESFAQFESLPPSPHNSPKNSVRHKILAQECNLRKSIAMLVACVPGLDEHQREEARDQLIRNLIMQVGALQESRMENRRIESIADEHTDKLLAAEIADNNKKECCSCVIL